MATTFTPKNSLTTKQEVDLLRSFVIGATGCDTEGEYRPEFVEEILHALKHSKSVGKFTTAKSFLARIRSGSSKA